MKNSLVKVAAILAVFLGLAGFVNAQVKDAMPERISVKPLLSSGLPVSVEFVAVTQIENDSLVTYSIANKDAQKLDEVEILLIVFKADGNARGGEGWRQSLSLAKDADVDFSRKMKTKVMPGDRVVFLLHKAKGQTGEWETNSTKIIEAAKAFIAGNNYTLPEAHFIKTK